MKQNPETTKKRSIRVALAGNPNSGKSTLFNKLTRSRQRIGNWPGVTVERKEGEFEIDGKNIIVVDLPGTYALTSFSMDESLARDYILETKPDIIVDVVDATAIERNLYLTITLLEMGTPVIIVLNMMDLVEKQGIEIDDREISEVLGVPVVKAVAPEGVGLDVLKRIIADNTITVSSELRIDYGVDIEQIIKSVEETIHGSRFSLIYPSRWIAIKILENDETIIKQMQEIERGRYILAVAREKSDLYRRRYGYELEMSIIERRYGFIHGLIKECVTQPALQPENRVDISDTIDQVVVNRYLGIPIFLLAMFLTFQLVFMVGNPIADLIDALFVLFSRGVTAGLTALSVPELFISLLTDGLIAGVGSVVVFLPNILILFFMIAVLEDSGYMARAAFVMDRIMHALGLHGKSFIPMIIGFGCNVPAIMGTRILESRKDRLLTIMIIPFMSCSARLPIFILFTGAFFSGYQGWVIFALYLIGIAIAIISAQIFKCIFFRQEVAPLIMELPPYRLPKLHGIVFHTWLRGWLFVKKAGTVIAAAVVIAWILASFPPGVQYGSRESLIGIIGRHIAPVFSTAGFGDWQSTVALIFGFFAKEAVVGTLGTTLAGEASLQAAIQQHFTALSAISFMIFSLLYVPCIPTFIMIWREAGKQWALIQVAYSTLIAWILSVCVYQIGRLIM